MSTVNIEFKKVYSIGKGFSSYSSKISNNSADVSRVISQVDSKIKARRQINQQLSSVTSSLNKLKNDMFLLEKFLKDSANKYEKAEENVEKIAKKFEIRLPLDKFNEKDFIESFDDSLKYFKTISHIPIGETGVIFLTIKDGQLVAKYKGIKVDSNNNHSYTQIRDSLTREFGGESGRFKKSFVTDLVNGIPLYGLRGAAKTKKFTDRFYLDELEQNTGKFKKLKNTPEYKKANHEISSRFKNIMKDEAKNTLKDFKVWDGVSKLDKAGKLVGAAGTLIDFGDNFIEASKEKTLFKKVTTFVSGFSVDVGVGIAANALIVKGAALGSAFAPPIGTVVGAAVGFGIGFFIGDFAEDLLKGKHNNKIKETVSKVTSKVSSIGQSLSKIVCW